MAEAAKREDGHRLLRVTSYSSWDAHMIYVSDYLIAFLPLYQYALQRCMPNARGTGVAPALVGGPLGV